MWSPVKGAELYETTAAQTDDVIHCNDTAPVCALSDLSCNTAYSVTVTPCSDFRGCNQTCAPQKHKTGVSWARLNESVEKMHVSCKMSSKNTTTSTHFSLGNLLLQLHVLRRSWIWCRPTTPHTGSFSPPLIRWTLPTASQPPDTTTRTLARQKTTHVSWHSCPVAPPMRSWP